MKPLGELTDLQMAILSCLWEREEATATEVHEALEPHTKLSRKSIGTLLGRLDEYGILEHRTEGREYVYRPRVTAEEVREAQTRRVVKRVFEGSVPDLVAYALESDEVEPGDAERIRKMVREWDEKGGDS